MIENSEIVAYLLVSTDFILFCQQEEAQNMN